MSYKGWGCGECENYRRGWMGTQGGDIIIPLTTSEILYNQNTYFLS